jgi:hypothetical protein
MEHAFTLSHVYQFRVVVRGISPLIWRRLLIRSDMSLATLHATLQIVFAWSDVRLHYFRIHGKEYGCARLGGPHSEDDPRHVPLVALHLHRGERFTYVYNSIDHWVCDLRLEAILPVDPRRFYPVCTDGKHTTPPEDCGGAWAYMQMVDRHHVPLEAMAVVAKALDRLWRRTIIPPCAKSLGTLRPFGRRSLNSTSTSTFSPYTLTVVTSIPGCDRWGHRKEPTVKYTIQVVITTDEGQPETRELACVEREDLTPTTLGLTLAEGKTMLKALQEIVVEQQMRAFLEAQRPCPHCGHRQRNKGYHTTQVRTVFGTIPLHTGQSHQLTRVPGVYHSGFYAVTDALHFTTPKFG